MLTTATDVLAPNYLLNSLSQALRERILNGSKLVPLEVSAPVYDFGQVVEHLYFPTGGGISNVFTMEDGGQIEVGMVGKEGVTGFPAVLAPGKSTSTLYAQFAGEAWKVPRAVIVAALQDAPDAMQPFFNYVDARLGQLTQYSACNRLHNLDERFSRWLLMAHDRATGNHIPTTHEFLALMLGVTRSGVTIAAATLQNTGIITCRRGKVVVVDRPALQQCACECYDAVEDRFEERMGYSIRKYRPGQAISPMPKLLPRLVSKRANSGGAD